jgi:hypothetical protein
MGSGQPDGRAPSCRQSTSAYGAPQQPARTAVEGSSRILEEKHMDLTTTNIWLGILAVVSLVEFLMILVGGFLAYRVYRQVTTTLETLERVHVAPLRARVDLILDEVQRVTDKVRHAQDSVSEAFRHVAGTGSVVADAVKSKTWPIVGIIQAIRSAAGTVMRNGRKNHRDNPYGSM